MTDKKQPEAPAFCWATELSMTQQPVTLSVTEAREVSSEMQRLHAENTALQQGYAAARLEIESLKSKIAEIEVEHADAPENLSCKSTQKRLATQWGFVSAGAQQPGDERAAFEQWSKVTNQGYDLARNVSGKLQTFESTETEHAWRGFFHGLRASHGQAPAQAAPSAVEGCTRSHPHENMDSACRAKAVIAEMQNMAARGAEATAHDLDRFVSMLTAALVEAPQPSPTPQADSQPAVVATNYKQALGSTNCMQCCVSYMLGVPMENVPDFANGGGWELFSEFVESKGYTAVMLPGNHEFEADYLASGATERGTPHMVVMNDGKLVHDPHPSNAGLVDVQCVWLLAKRASPTQWQQDEHTAFEASAKTYTSNVSFERDASDYVDMTASLLWHGWKLRASRGQAPAQAAPPPCWGRSVPVSEADMVLAAMETGEWELQRLLPQTCFTSEANTRNAWSVKRSAAPYCTKDGLRIWTGATPLEALCNGAAALGVELPGCSETAALPKTMVVILGEQAELRRLSDCCPELNLSNYGPDDVAELNGWAIEVSQCIDRALAAQPASKPSPASQGDALSQAASDVLAERQRQISAEGRTQSHDDLEHEPGQLSSAAACYALNASEWLTRPYVSRAGYATLSFIDLSNWPWDGSWWKPKNERRDLVKAGALIIAELERMDRADAARAAQEGK